ncbi:MAG: phosphoribosylformylglycinamidine synthase subunit PurL [Gemmatimonadetes bacterium]|nr:phosphoribosylformylglycinamidine synthase subunit PurL [Gemmatimonadota bacterium]
MPHPERAVDALLGSCDGRPLFESVRDHAEARRAATPRTRTRTRTRLAARQSSAAAPNTASSTQPQAARAADASGQGHVPDGRKTAIEPGRATRSGTGTGAGTGTGTSSPPPAPCPGDPPITPPLGAQHGLSAEEYARILDLLGRPPTYTELGVFSALWSEHCGYKNSKPLLKMLPTQAPWVLQGPGENAGVIDLGAGWALAFKIESHNHPSAVEPYQGAATGVGGILRDVFTMGARPVAVLDSLRFGPLSHSRSRYLLAGVVKGAGDYGNCVGIPNLGGEIYFDAPYAANPLVNVMALGLLRKGQLIRAHASGPGNPILAVGARTGRDGIHGATFASEELAAQSEASRPQVQVGDPFTEKLLLEASLELVRSGSIVGIQDMGAAGLASSSSEMAARAGTGVDIDVTRLPTREPGMTPYEILLSESQERMLVVARAGHEPQVTRILGKWQLEAAVIGQVTADGVYRVREHGRVVCQIPAAALVNGCPTYLREGRESVEVERLRAWDPSELDATPTATHPMRLLLRLLSSPSIASKQWIYQQYDTTVRTATVLPPGRSDAGVLRLRGTSLGIAATVDGNGRYVYLNPRRGAMIAVAEAARNLVCVGARPRAVTDNLNFGNPLKPEVYYQFREAVLGIAEACRRFETPVVGGNVSFYNESPGGGIYPTPVIGMVGVLEDVGRRLGLGFRDPGDAVVLLGRNTSELGGSEYLKVIHGRLAGDAPALDLDAEKALQEAVLALAAAGLLKSAHDCSEGGLAVCLAESAIAEPERLLGLEVELADDLPLVALLFGEAQGRVVVSCAPEHAPRVLQTAAEFGVPAAALGHVGEVGGRFVIRTPTARLDLPAAELAEAYHQAIPRLMEHSPAAVEVEIEHPPMPR